MSPLDREADRLQSRRAAYDVLYHGRNIEPNDMWWFDPVRNLDRLEAERARQARLQEDQDPFIIPKNWVFTP